MPLDDTKQKPIEGGNKPSLRKTVLNIAKAIAKVTLGLMIRDATASALKDLTEEVNDLFHDVNVEVVEEIEEDDPDQM